MQVETLLRAYHRGLLGLHRNTYSRRKVTRQRGRRPT
jgi:hypothetical protein